MRATPPSVVSGELDVGSPEDGGALDGEALVGGALLVGGVVAGGAEDVGGAGVVCTAGVVDGVLVGGVLVGGTGASGGAVLDGGTVAGGGTAVDGGTTTGALVEGGVLGGAPVPGSADPAPVGSALVVGVRIVDRPADDGSTVGATAAGTWGAAVRTGVPRDARAAGEDTASPVDTSPGVPRPAGGPPGAPAGEVEGTEETPGPAGTGRARALVIGEAHPAGVALALSPGGAETSAADPGCAVTRGTSSTTAPASSPQQASTRRATSSRPATDTWRRGGEMVPPTACRGRAPAAVEPVWASAEPPSSPSGPRCRPCRPSTTLPVPVLPPAVRAEPARRPLPS